MSKPNGVSFPRSKLYLKTMELLRNRPVTLTYIDIERVTGLSPLWLTTIMQHPEISPSVDRIELLYEYLSGKQLDIAG